jgi:hypothetical protein
MILVTKPTCTPGFHVAEKGDWLRHQKAKSTPRASKPETGH